MCGFFGMIYGNERPDRAALDGAAGHVAYRGRDENDVYEDGSCFLAHYRLSIIDLSGGTQPMKDVSGRYVIVFNGELYNYVELKAELEGRGLRLATKSDTEVFLLGVSEFGAEFLKKAEGMFAAAIWDTKERTLTLARDPLGKKPLFVCSLPGGGVAFGSSLACFKNLPGWSGDISRAGVVSFVQYGFIPAPLTIYKAARKVLPGEVEKYSLLDKLWRCEKYGVLTFGDRGGIGEEEIADKLRTAVSIRLRTDVPLGMTFSGGVDSGLLACMVKELGCSLKLFNIDYESEGNKSPERRNARLAAERLGFELIEDDFKPDELFSSLADSYRHYDEPCSQLPVVYAYQILKAIRNNGFKVVVTGNGADEIFFGYTGNRSIRLRSDLLRYAMPLAPDFILPANVRKLKRGGWADYIFEKEMCVAADVESALGYGKYEAEAGGAEYLAVVKESLTAANFQRYSDYALWRQLYYGGSMSNYTLPDVSGMQAQVEARSPFLDWSFIQSVKDIDDKLRIGSYRTDADNKSVLKKMYAKRLGADLAYDKKRGMGWNIRWDMWMIHEPAVNNLFRRSIDTLSDYGIDPKWFAGHFDNYCNADSFAAAGGDESVYGFMLALWLKKEFEGEGALDEWMAPLKGFKPTGTYE